MRPCWTPPSTRCATTCSTSCSLCSAGWEDHRKQHREQHREVITRGTGSVVLLTSGIGPPRSRGFRLGGPRSIGHDAHRNPVRMTPARYIMVGGFLGAGKTTAILRMAEALDRGGRRVGLITNDQSVGLVDTTVLSAHGFPVEEITGGCFCCRFNSLVDAAERLAAGDAPRRLHRRAGRQLHGPARLGELSAAADVRRRLHRRPAQRRRRPGAGAARPRHRAGPVVQPQGPLRLPQAARGSRAHPDQQGRRDRAGARRRAPRGAWRGSIRRRGSSRCRRGPARAWTPGSTS